MTSNQDQPPYVFQVRDGGSLNVSGVAFGGSINRNDNRRNDNRNDNRRNDYSRNDRSVGKTLNHNYGYSHSSGDPFARLVSSYDESPTALGRAGLPFGGGTRPITNQEESDYQLAMRLQQDALACDPFHGSSRAGGHGSGVPSALPRSIHPKSGQEALRLQPSDESEDRPPALIPDNCYKPSVLPRPEQLGASGRRQEQPGDEFAEQFQRFAGPSDRPRLFIDPSAEPVAAPSETSARSQVSAYYEARDMPFDVRYAEHYSNGITLEGLSDRRTVDKSGANELLDQWTEQVEQGKKDKLVVVALTLSGCPVTPEGAEIIAKFLKENVRPFVKSVDLSASLTHTNETTGPQVMQILLWALDKAPKLRAVFLERNALSPKAAKHVAKFFGRLPKDKVEVLSLTDAGLHSSSAARVFGKVTSGSLKSLAVGEIAAAEDQADGTFIQAVANVVENAVNLEKLDLHNLRGSNTMEVWADMTQALAMMTSKCGSSNKITAIDVSDANLGVDQVNDLSYVLSKSQIEYLNLSGVGLGPQDFKQLFESMGYTGRDRLVGCSFEGNELGPEGAKHFRALLKLQPSITKLNVAETELGNEGLGHVLCGLREAGITGMEYLNVASNDLDGDGFEKLESFLNDVTVARLNMEGNGLEKNAPQADRIRALCNGVELDTPFSRASSDGSGSFFFHDGTPSTFKSSTSSELGNVEKPADGTAKSPPKTVSFSTPAGSGDSPHVRSGSSTKGSPTTSEKASPRLVIGEGQSVVLEASQPQPKPEPQLEPKPIGENANSPQSQLLGNKAVLAEAFKDREDGTNVIEEAWYLSEFIRPVIDDIAHVSVKLDPLHRKLLINFVGESASTSSIVATIFRDTQLKDELDKLVLTQEAQVVEAQAAAQVAAKAAQVAKKMRRKRIRMIQKAWHAVPNKAEVLRLIVAVVWVDMDRAQRDAMFAESGLIYNFLTKEDAKRILVALGKGDETSRMTDRTKKPLIISTLFEALKGKFGR